MKDQHKTHRYRFSKEERLKSRKSIDEIFRSGKSITVPPFRLLYRKMDNGAIPAKMTVAVPVKLFKNAVDRNRVKRMTRESYRKRKEELVEKLKASGISLELIFLYQSSKILKYSEIDRVVSILLKKIGQK